MCTYFHSCDHFLAANNSDSIYAELFAAAKSNDLKTFKYIIEEREQNASALEWFPPLALKAAAKGSLDVMQYIVEREPWILDKKNKAGDMIIHVVTKTHQLDAIRFLACEKPSALGRKNSNGETLGHIAAR